MKDWYIRNRERVLEQKRSGRIAEPERFHGYDRTTDAKRRADPVHVSERNRRWRERNAARLALLPARVNHGAFDAVTPEVAYWVGFLMADGCVCDDTISLQLAHRDAGHVFKFARFLELRRDPYPNVNLTVITTKSKRLAAALGVFGVLPRKTHTAKAVGVETNRDFWRGVVDGDGSIVLLSRIPGYPVLSLCGSRPLMEQFAAYVSSLLDGRPVRVGPHKSIWDVRLAGNYAVRVIRELYKGATIFLDRKMELANVAMAFQFRRPPSGPSAYLRKATSEV